MKDGRMGEDAVSDRKTPAAEKSAEKGAEPAREDLAPRLLRRFMRRAIGWSNRRSGGVITVHERPKRADRIGAAPLSGLRHGPAAIVMQGPVVAEDDFTLDTLRLYARRMPDCMLILSTWADADPALLAPIEAEGVEVLRLEKPATPGPFNVNMQLASARAGVRRAAERGAEWILKTRPDQRLYAPEAIAGLIARALAFPPAEGARQRHRIIGVGQGSLLFAPYHVTDQTVFGHAEDMTLYWDAPLREGSPPGQTSAAAAELFARMPIDELCRTASPEMYIGSRYLERIGRGIDWTIRDSWAAYRDHFCFADHSSTDFLWIKGHNITQREFMVRYDRTTNRREIGFAEWLMLHQGILPVEAAEDYAAMIKTPFTPFAPSW